MTAAEEKSTDLEMGIISTTSQPQIYLEQLPQINIVTSNQYQQPRHDDKKLGSDEFYVKSIPTDSSEDDSNQCNFVTWDSPSDPENPTNFPTWLRWTLIYLVSAITFMAGLSSSMFAPSVPALMKEFGSENQILGSFVVTIFVLGLGSGPFVFAPFSELYGRSSVQHVGSFGFLAFTIACARSTSLEMLIIMRLFQGIFAAVPLTQGGGIIADMVRQEERGFAMAMFTMGTLLGPVVGPVSGSFLGAAMGWRWVFYVIAMALGFLSFIGLAFWRETYAPVILRRKAARLRQESGNIDLRTKHDTGLTPRAFFLQGITRPVKMLIFSPILAAMCLHMGLAYSYFYLLFTTFTDIFIIRYHFKSNIVGLSYLGVGMGFLGGQVIFANVSDSLMKKLAKKGDGELKPEYRLPLACIGAIFIPVGFFWYGWSVQAEVFWLVPIIGTAIIGFGNSLVFIPIQAYTIDAFEVYSASGLAANTIVRSLMAGLIPLAGPKLYEKLGYGWGNSLLAFMAAALIPLPFLLFFYGERLRGANKERMAKL